MSVMADALLAFVFMTLSMSIDSPMMNIINMTPRLAKKSRESLGRITPSSIGPRITPVSNSPTNEGMPNRPAMMPSILPKTSMSSIDCRRLVSNTFYCSACGRHDIGAAVYHCDLVNYF